MGMTTGTGMIADLLRLTQWLSPAFPLSGYAYSHGLETAVAEGRVTDGPSARDWIAAVLIHGTGALDAWAIGAVMGGAPPDGVEATIRARAGGAERWRETRDMGAAFVGATRATGEPAIPDLTLPVALGLRARGMERAVVVALYLQSFAGQLVSAAVRLVPLGQTEGQTILRDLHREILDLAAVDQADPPGSAALLAELDAMRHETLSPRIFRT